PTSPGFLTLSLHDALPICRPSENAEGLIARPRVEAPDRVARRIGAQQLGIGDEPVDRDAAALTQYLRMLGVGHGNLAAGDELVADRKSTRLNSSHVKISYA